MAGSLFFLANFIFSCCLLILVLVGLFPELLASAVGPTGHNLQRVVHLLLTFLAIPLFVTILFKNSSRMRSLPSFSIALTALIFLISLSASSFMAAFSLRSFQEVGAYASILLLTVVFAEAFRVVGRWVLLGIVIGVCIVVTGRFLAFLVSGYMEGGFSSRGPIIDGFSNVRSFNHIQPCLIFGLLVAHKEFRSRNKNLFDAGVLFLLVFQWVLVWYSLGRGVVVGMVGGAVFVLVCGIFLNSKESVRHFLLLFFLVLVSLTTYYVLISALPEFIGSTWPGGRATTYATRLHADSSGRLELWMDSFQAIGKSPLWGVGGQGFFLIDSKFDFGSAHNIVINIAVEFGLISVVILLVSALLVFRICLMDLFINRNNSELVLIAGSLCSMVIYSSFSGVFLSPYSQIFVALFAGAYLSFGRLNEAHTHWKSRTLVAVAPLCVIAVLLASLFVLTGFGDLLLNSDGIKSCLYANYMCYPRFWLNGDFWSL